MLGRLESQSSSNLVCSYNCQVMNGNNATAAANVYASVPHARDKVTIICTHILSDICTSYGAPAKGISIEVCPITPGKLEILQRCVAHSQM